MSDQGFDQAEAARIESLRAEVAAFDDNQRAANAEQADLAIAPALDFIEADWFALMIEAATKAKTEMTTAPRLSSLFGNILDTAALLPRFIQDARREALSAIVNQARQSSN